MVNMVTCDKMIMIKFAMTKQNMCIHHFLDLSSIPELKPVLN